MNRGENVWQFIRRDWLSVVNSQNDIVAHGCEAWNKLAGQPWRIMSVGLRHCTRGF